MRFMTPKQEVAMRAKIEKAVLSLGAQRSAKETGIYPFWVETIHGRLWISPCATAIRTRFDSIPREAPWGTSLNRFSGKWNFEFGLQPTESEINAAIFSIQAILPDALDKAA